MHKTIYPLLFGLLYLVFSSNVQAQYSTEQDLIKAFELHEKASKVNSAQQIIDFQPFIEVATNNNWQKAWVKIQVSKAILYSQSYQLKNLQPVINETLPVARKLELFDEIVVLEANLLHGSMHSDSITTTITAEEIIAKLPQMKNSVYRNDVMLCLSGYFYTQGDLLASLKITLKIGDEEGGFKLGKLASIYYRVGDMQKFNDYSEQYLILSEKLDDLPLKDLVLYIRLPLLFIKGDFEGIKTYLHQLEQAVDISDDAVFVADMYRFKGRLALHQHDYSLAKSFLNKSKSIYQTHSLTSDIMLADLVLLKIMLAESDFSAARDKLLVIKPDVISYAITSDFQKYYQMATTTYQSLNDYESAFTAAEQLKKYELIQAKVRNQAEIIKFEYEQSLNDKVIEQAHMEEKQAQQNVIWFLIIIVALLIICLLIIVLYKQSTAKQKLNILANTDVLTGAPNRRAILNAAEQQLQYCQENQLPLTIVIADIDLFKSINDEFGHDIGDEVLRVFSDCSKQAIRKSEFYGRFGGEEWLFVLPQTKVTFAKTLFERLNQAIEKRGDDIPFDCERLTFSMGAVELEQGDTVKSMIDRADKLLYQAKDNGRNRICY